jgi:predicted dehydrogenase
LQDQPTHSPARRSFLQHATLAATSLIGTSRAWAGANDRVRVALIGGGGRARALINEMLVNTGVDVVAVCDPDRNRLEQRAAEIQAKTGKRPRVEADMRKLLEDKSVDAVTIATTNHWHALAAIWACQNGKHVYVEKPVCHNIFEGQRMVDAARKYKRVMQGGTQRRSWGRFRRVAELLSQGVIGDVYMARCLLTRYRAPIGFKDTEPAPKWLNWDLWVGPAPMQPYHANLVHYNWHFFWDFGNGEIGNNGSHYIDVVRWFMGKRLPSRVLVAGGRFGPRDQAQTPNVVNANYQFDDGKILECEVRNVHTPEPSQFHVYGNKGYLYFQEDIFKRKFDYQVYLGDNEKPEPDMGTHPDLDHFGIFAQAIRENKPNLVSCDIEEARISATYCLMADIAYRLNRSLTFDPGTERFVSDEQANGMLSRRYREPYVVPEKV